MKRLHFILGTAGGALSPFIRGKDRKLRHDAAMTYIQTGSEITFRPGLHMRSRVRLFRETPTQMPVSWLISDLNGEALLVVVCSAKRINISGFEKPPLSFV